MGASNKKLSQNDSSLEIFSIIWLNPSFHNSDERLKAQKKLRTLINQLQIFENYDDCEEYIRSVNNTYNRFICIINDESARKIVPRIEQLRQVYVIYIHTFDIQSTLLWAKQYLKVQTIFFLYFIRRLNKNISDKMCN